MTLPRAPAPRREARGTALTANGRGEKNPSMNPNNLPAVRQERERLIDALCDAFSRDAFDDDELERRMTLAHKATTLAELDTLRSELGLPARTEVALQPAARTTTALTPHRQGPRTALAVFGSSRRGGAWTPPPRMTATAVFGDVELDFREAVMAPGVTHVNATAVFGNVTLYVPPHLAVDMHGIAIFGAFEELDRAPAQLDPDAPLLRVHGRSVFGSVEIETRLPGETRRQARKRRRRELRGPGDQR